MHYRLYYTVYYVSTNICQCIHILETQDYIKRPVDRYVFQEAAKDVSTLMSEFYPLEFEAAADIIINVQMRITRGDFSVANCDEVLKNLIRFVDGN